MKQFEIQMVGAPTETLYATSERAARNWANKNGYNVIRELVKIIVK